MTLPYRMLPQPPQHGGYDRRWAGELTRGIKALFQQLLEGDIEFLGNVVMRGGRAEKTRLVTAATDTLRLDDYYVDVNRAGTVALELPGGPTLGHTLVVQDSSGAASSNAITISAPAGVTLNGTVAGSITLTTNYGRRTFVYNGSKWIGS